MSSLTLLTAAHVAPMSSPLLRDAGVVFNGAGIVEVGSTTVLRREYPEALIHDLGNATILPGLLNAHTHLELSDVARGEVPAGGFAAWLLERVRHTSVPLSAQEMSARIDRAVAIGVQQCLRFGVTTVGDISRFSAITRPLLARSALNAVSFGEVTGMAQRREQLDARLSEAVDTTAASEHLHIGVSPHAPYSVEPAGYRACLAAASERGLPLATHLAESPDEAEFLAHHTGPLRELWNHLGWDERVPTFPEGPIRLAVEAGLLNYPRTLLAHVNYCDDDELRLLAAGHASVVYCPRTHAFFGHPPHRWREMLAAGINVAVGTDSTASSPDLNLVDELRMLHHLAPEVPPDRLWELATTRAADAISVRDRCGTLTAGARADLAVFRTGSNEPLAEILETNLLPKTWLSGVPFGDALI